MGGHAGTGELVDDFDVSQRRQYLLHSDKEYVLICELPSGSSLNVAEARIAVFELKLLAPTIPIPFSSSFAFLLI